MIRRGPAWEIARFLLIAVASGLMAIVIVATARAEDCSAYGLRTRAYRACDVFGNCEMRYRCVRSAPSVYGYYRNLDEEGGRHCREIRRAVGDQHLTVDGAKKAANDAWAGTIRFHLGEKFMSLENARAVIYTCSRSSIKEGGVTTLGQTFTRCEIEAVPCMAMKERAEREDR